MLIMMRDGTHVMAFQAFPSSPGRDTCTEHGSRSRVWWPTLCRTASPWLSLRWRHLDERMYLCVLIHQGIELAQVALVHYFADLQQEPS